TVTWISSESLRLPVPLSVTMTVIGNVPGPCASVGVQVNAPPAVIAAPAGAPAPSENVSVCAGTSASVAVAVKLRSASSLTVLFPMAARTGAVFGWLATVIVIASLAFSAGVPLSVTMTVTGKLPVAEGVQLKAPDAAPIVAPAGAPAPSENVIATPTVPDLLPIGARTGATLTSLT